MIVFRDDVFRDITYKIANEYVTVRLKIYYQKLKQHKKEQEDKIFSLTNMAKQQSEVPSLDLTTSEGDRTRTESRVKSRKISGNVSGTMSGYVTPQDTEIGSEVV